MTGFTLALDLDDAAARAGLKRLEDKGRDLAPLLDEIGAYVDFSSRRRFELGVGPDGVPWPPSIRAREDGGQTLVDQGWLRQIDHVVQGNEVVSGPPSITAPYAAVHQFGATIRPTAGEFLTFRIGERWVRAREVTIPPRPYMGINDEDGREIAQIALDWLQEGFEV